MWLAKLILFFAGTSHQENIHVKNVDDSSVVQIGGKTFSDVEDERYKTFYVNDCTLTFEESCEKNQCSGSVERACSGDVPEKIKWNPCRKSKIRSGFELTS